MCGLLTKTSVAEGNEPLADGTITWEYLKENIIKQSSPDKLKQWQIKYKDDFSQLNCTIIPEKLYSKSDFRVLQIFATRFASSKECMKRIILILLASKQVSSAKMFGDYLYAQRQWVPTEFWGDILTAIVEYHKGGREFSEYYLQILRCFEYLEEVAPHFRPALEGLTDIVSIYMVRFTPLYYILRKLDLRAADASTSSEHRGILREQVQYSHRMRKDFGDILKIQKDEPPSAYLPTIESYFDATHYMKRAMLNEGEYFKINFWLRKNILWNDRDETYIIENDLYRVAYISYLTGVTEERVQKFVTLCALGCMAWYLGRNRPVKVDGIDEACDGIKQLVDAYQKLPPPREGTIIPCRIKSQRNDGAQLKPITMQVKSHDKSPIAFFTWQMILLRQFEVPFDFISMHDFAQHATDIELLTNATLINYCAAFRMEAAVRIYIKTE